MHAQQSKWLWCFWTSDVGRPLAPHHTWAKICIRRFVMMNKFPWWLKMSAYKCECPKSKYFCYRWGPGAKSLVEVQLIPKSTRDLQHFQCKTLINFALTHYFWRGISLHVLYKVKSHWPLRPILNHASKGLGAHWKNKQIPIFVNLQNVDTNSLIHDLYGVRARERHKQHWLQTVGLMPCNQCSRSRLIPVYV